MPELKFKKMNLKSLTNERATYSFCELKDFIDWKVERVYFMQDIHADLGGHCHFEEKEFFIMSKGSCTAVIDQGNGLEEIRMEGPADGVYIGDHVWHAFKDFSEDAVLLALSSTNYREDRSDYCEDYEEYRTILKNKGYIS